MTKINKLTAPMAAVACVLFLYNLVSRTHGVQISDWNAHSDQFLSNPKAIESNDCLFPLKKAFLFATPHLAYGERISCAFKEGQTYPSPVVVGVVEKTTAWHGPAHSIDIGWDAYSVWYSRSAHLFFASTREDWPGLLTALTDPRFLTSSPSPEHHQYPWLVSLIYFSAMKIVGTAHPLPLQALQLLVFAAVCCLYWANRKKMSTSLVLLFIAAPIGGIFLLKLYADIWVLLCALLMIHAFHRKRWLSLAITVCVGVWLKSEAWVQIACLLMGFALVAKAPARKNIFFVIPIFAVSVGLYHWWAMAVPTSHYVSLVGRLSEAITYTHRVPKILGYYADVLFRPGHWVILWPLSIYLLVKHKGPARKLLLPISAILMAVPLAFLRFPGESFKEVVLTGSNRALWQCLPLLFFALTQAGSEQSDQNQS